jgi:Putative zinc-finger
MPARKTAATVLTQKTCKEITDLIYNYLNDQLRPAIKKDFERHIRICPDCVNFLNTYKKIVGATAVLRIEEIPVKVRKNILDFLRNRIGHSKS